MKKALLTITVLQFILVLCYSQQYNNFEFEENLPITILSNIDPLWQIGAPNKTFFEAASSLPNAIITDSINTYPVGVSTSFEVTIDDNTLWSWPFMQIDWDFKIDTEDGVDGGIIETSYDDGQTWKNVFSDPDFRPDIVGDYQTDTLFNGQVGVTGIENWNWMSICWGTYSGTLPDFPETIKVRYTFVSDSIDTQQAGWMLDNLQTQTLIIGSTSDQNLQPISVFPNPTTDLLFFKLEELGTAAVNVEVYDNGGQLVITKSLNPLRSQRASIAVEDLAVGRYLILFRGEEVTLRSSFVKVE